MNDIVDCQLVHGYLEKMIKLVYLLNLNFLGLVLSVLNHLNNLYYKQLLRVAPVVPL